MECDLFLCKDTLVWLPCIIFTDLWSVIDAEKLWLRCIENKLMEFNESVYAFAWTIYAHRLEFSCINFVYMYL